MRGKYDGPKNAKMGQELEGDGTPAGEAGGARRVLGAVCLPRRVGTHAHACPVFPHIEFWTFLDRRLKDVPVLPHPTFSSVDFWPTPFFSCSKHFSGPTGGPTC